MFYRISVLYTGNSYTKNTLNVKLHINNLTMKDINRKHQNVCRLPHEITGSPKS